MTVATRELGVVLVDDDAYGPVAIPLQHVHLAVMTGLGIVDDISDQIHA